MTPRNQTCLPCLLTILLLSVSAGAQTSEEHHGIAYKLPRPDFSQYRKSEPLRISGDGDHVIEGQVYSPVEGEFGIRIDNHFRGHITIRNCIFLGANGAADDGLDPGNGGGILAWQTSNLLIEHNYFEYVQGFCVRIMGSKEHPSTNIRVVGNDMYCLQAEYQQKTAWGWTADAVQFIRVAGPGNCISKNRCVNLPGKSYLTDFINVYCSSGTRESPLWVSENVLCGAGAEGLYNQYGCGIQLNDHPADEDGGEYVKAKGNLLIDPGIVGININGGLQAGILDNCILMSHVYRTSLADGPVKHHPAWAAITLFNYSGGISRDSGHEVRGNRVAFREPGPAPFVNRTKPPETVVEGNDWDVKLDRSELIRARLKE